MAELGIDAEIIDLRTIRPMDIETVISSISKENQSLYYHRRRVSPIRCWS